VKILLSVHTVQCTHFIVPRFQVCGAPHERRSLDLRVGWSAAPAASRSVVQSFEHSVVSN